MSLPRICIVPTASGASAVQVLWRYVDNKPVLDHIGSAHTPEELALLKSQAQRLIDGDQLALDFGVASGSTGRLNDPVPVTKTGDLLDANRLRLFI
ncbi:MAG: hypothetical protein Q4A31_08705 [Corynebacterium sp.]|uniref:hypothetical protein n=1 Tax=Corynebacterium sp. TaxID=1720 RepID=UPI0026DB20D0|nr:hypothetical protein [Corynebacterium sp.]MDO4761982.1 hypothetical protein [Corynebacterium sp.]